MDLQDSANGVQPVESDELSGFQNTGLKRHGNVLHSLPDGPALFTSLHRAMHGDRIPFKKSHGADIDISGIVLFRDEYTRDDGEVQTGVRVVLLGADGKQYSTMSPWAVESVASWLRMAGLPPWSHGIHAHIVCRPGKQGGDYVSVEFGV